MRISDWSSDVCSSDLGGGEGLQALRGPWPLSLCDEDRLSILALEISFCRQGKTPGAGPLSRHEPQRCQGGAAECGALAQEWHRPCSAGEAACCNTPGGSRDDLRGGGARVACPAGGWLGASPCSRCAQKSGTGCVSKDWRD